MHYLYKTVDGDVLDNICWQHYGAQQQHLFASLGLDLNLLNDVPGAIEQLGNAAHALPQNLGDIVEVVLNHNENLASFGRKLPAGIEIKLPEIQVHSASAHHVSLWE